MADEQPKSGFDRLRDNIHILLHLPADAGEAEATKKPDYGNKPDNRPYAPAIPVKKPEAKPEPKKAEPKAQPPAYKHGGKVKKTGMAKVHKGEKVLTSKQQKKLGGKKKEHGHKRA